MKRIVLMALLALTLPLAAFASGVDIQNGAGTLIVYNGNTLQLSAPGSPITAYNDSVYGSNLGYLNFTTGTLTSGNFTSGATFGPGGSFVITSNGSAGMPPAGAIFTGSFTGATWTESAVGGGLYSYNLSGIVNGTWYNGSKVVGATTQLSGYTTGLWDGGSIALSSGDTNIAVPEPGTLGLLGTGLVGIAGMVRRKLFGA